MDEITSDWRKIDNESSAQGKSLPRAPDHLGTLDYVPSEHLDEIANDENGACFLQGTLFSDDELGWCMVSGWGVECGIPIVFYSSVLEMDMPNVVEHHASLEDVLTLIKNSGSPPSYR